MLSHSLCECGMAMCPLLSLGGFVLFSLILMLAYVCVWFLCILFSASLRYLQLVHASCECCSFALYSSVILQTTLSLCVGAWMTLYVPVCRCMDDTIFCSFVMVTVPL